MLPETAILVIAHKGCNAIDGSLTFGTLMTPHKMTSDYCTSPEAAILPATGEGCNEIHCPVSSTSPTNIGMGLEPSRGGYRVMHSHCP